MARYTTRDAIEWALFEAEAPLSPSEIVQKTGYNPNTIRTELGRMRKRNLVKRHGRGQEGGDGEYELPKERLKQLRLRPPCAPNDAPAGGAHRRIDEPVGGRYVFGRPPIGREDGGILHPVYFEEHAMIQDREGVYRLAPTGEPSPMAFTSDYARSITPNLDRVIEYRVRGTLSSGRYPALQRLLIEQTGGRIYHGGDYLVQIGDSQDIYSVQRMPGGKVRFRPHSDIAEPFVLELDEGRIINVDDVQIIGRVILEARPQ